MGFLRCLSDRIENDLLYNILLDPATRLSMLPVSDVIVMSLAKTKIKGKSFLLDIEVDSLYLPSLAVAFSVIS